MKASTVLLLAVIVHNKIMALLLDPSVVLDRYVPMYVLLAPRSHLSLNLWSGPEIVKLNPNCTPTSGRV